MNLSLETAFFPPKLKEAALNPVLKRHNLNYPEFANFNSISNFGFLSKVLIEKVVANQTISYIEDNNLYECFKSAYRKYRRSETALIKDHNDFAAAIDKEQSVILVLLALCATFDRVDHDISRLSTRFGICGTVFEWFKSYLTA